jgi:excisionase family DNA binding protein
VRNILSGQGSPQQRRALIEASLDQEWYTVGEAARVLGEHPKTVYKRIQNRELSVSQPSPRKIKIHRSDLAAYLSQERPNQAHRISQILQEFSENPRGDKGV